MAAQPCQTSESNIRSSPALLDPSRGDGLGVGVSGETQEANAVARGKKKEGRGKKKEERGKKKEARIKTQEAGGKKEKTARDQ